MVQQLLLWVAGAFCCLLRGGSAAEERSCRRACSPRTPCCPLLRRALRPILPSRAPPFPNLSLSSCLPSPIARVADRYRPLPEAVYGAASREHPLIMTRMDLTDARVGEEGPEGLGWAERLLRCEHPESHEAIASALWEAASDADAVAALERIGREGVEAWEEAVRAGGRGGDAARGGGLGVGGPAGGEGDGGREGGGRGGRRSRNDDAELERG